MWIFIRILFFAIIILAGLYFWNPNLFKFNKLFYNSEKLEIKQYILTPDPSVLFLEWLKISTSKAYDFNWIASSVDLYFEAVKLFQVNIITLLDQSNNKSITLKTYLIQLHHILNALDNAIANLTSFYTQEETTADTYLQQKQQWDNMFNQWFIEQDSNTVVNWVKISYKNWPEYIKHRIIANASKIVVSKLQSIKQLVYLKLDLLENNQEDIINNFNLIRWDLLPKLLNLKKKLEWNYYY